MNIKLLLLTLLLLSSLAHASDLYIKLGATTSTAQVNQIQKIVTQKGYRLHIQEDEERYNLYAGAFSSQAQALQALQTLQRIFPSAVAVKLRPQTFAQTSKRSTQATQESSSTAKNTPNTDSRASERPFFVQLALGFHDTKGEISGDAEAEEPSASGMSYGVGFGYMFSDEFWASLGYEILGTGDVTLSNIYTSLNYNFLRTEDFNLFAGALVGYSTLSWDSAPQENATATGPSSFFAGAQVGICYPFGLEGLSFISSYSLTSLNLKTNLSGGTTPSAIEHTMTHKIQLGLQYNF